MNKAAVDYIVQFLLGEQNAGLSRHVRYGRSSAGCEMERGVFIKVSGFFDAGVFMTDASMPRLPLAELDGVPILFGEGTISREADVLTVDADLIAGSFFLLSRYEEVLTPHARDEHGRFLGRDSLPYRAGFLHRPLVDEYGRLLRGWLRALGLPAAEPPAEYRGVTLTHDVDAPWLPARSMLRQLLAALASGKAVFRGLRNILGWMRSPHTQPVYTFPWLIKRDKAVMDVYAHRGKVIYFMLCCRWSRSDNAYCRLNKKNTRKLIALLKESGAEIGLHASHRAGRTPSLVQQELAALRRVTGTPVASNRHHYLSSRSPADMSLLHGMGIRDDYTMGYADIAGFRLGTCRPVRWIDPTRQEPTPLVLHPLTMMDCTFYDKRYMNLSEEQAQAAAENLARQVKEHNGELVILWHNTEVAPDVTGYSKRLYEHLTGLLAQDE